MKDLDAEKIEPAPDARRQSVELRQAQSDEGPAIERLILEQGPNQWNHLPSDEVRRNVEGIATGEASAVVAELDGALVGAAIYGIGHPYKRLQPPGRESVERGYVSEVVVHRGHVGVSIGTKLLRAAIDRLVEQGMREIYAKRHADNIPSGRMMEKSGMEIVDEFDDPEIRPHGSRRTTVTRYTVPS